MAITASVSKIKRQNNTDRTLFVTWNFSRKNTKEYKTIWYYSTGNDVWFEGSNSTVTIKQSIYSAPSNAKKVKFKVKPIATMYKANKKDQPHWVAEYSTTKAFTFNPLPATPPSPSVNISDLKLTAEITGVTNPSDNTNSKTKNILFKIIRRELKSDGTYGTPQTISNAEAKVPLKLGQASYSYNVTSGYEYMVRCWAVDDGGDISDEYSESSYLGTEPAASKGIRLLRVISKENDKYVVGINWWDVKNAENYEIEYTTVKRYFDSNPSEVSSITIEAAAAGHAEISLDGGCEYFFRVRAVNDSGKSAWTEIKSLVVGTEPAAPTTWSSSATVITGEPLYLYWIHNSEDNSSQKEAQLEINGVPYTITNDAVYGINSSGEVYKIRDFSDDDEKDNTTLCSIDTSKYIQGENIKWRVRTSGITGNFGEWSVYRTVDIYARPTLDISLINYENSETNIIESFPFFLQGQAEPNTELQYPIGYHVTIKANEGYETSDDFGNSKIVTEGDIIFSKYLDVEKTELNLELSASNIDLKNNISYTAICTAAMNSGLTANSELTFEVAWMDEEYTPDASIGVESDDEVTTFIRPYCVTIDEHKNEELVPGVMLSVYRREFDGTFTELQTGIDNLSNTTIIDIHPALDYARYRIVAKTKSTGAISYYDVPGYYIGEKSIILQWNETWTSYNTLNEDALEAAPRSSSLLRLPYNIDISDKYSPDVELVEYIGRSHPVSYYGTQIGETATWKVDIDKEDEETLYALRRLATWMGDVYVREPSGSGYWANVVVSFSQTHNEVVIPVSLDITRVEGGK